MVDGFALKDPAKASVVEIGSLALELIKKHNPNS